MLEKLKSKEFSNLTKPLNSVPLPILWGMSPRRIAFCNTAFTKLTGISKKEIGRGKWMECINRLDRKRILEVLDLSFAENSDTQVDLRIKISSRKSKNCTALINKSKEDLWFITLIDQKSSIVENIIEGREAYSRIVSKNKVSSAAIKKEMNKSVIGKGSYNLAQIVKLSQDSIISFTTGGIIETWNRGAQELYGYSPSEAIGKHLSIIVPEERKDEVANLLKTLKQNRIIDAYETIRQKKDKSYVHISLMVSPIIDSDGKVIAGFSVARDITRRQEAEEALLNQAHQLARTNAELEQFAWMAAHDLKEPIRTMTTYAHLVADEIDADPSSDLGRMLKFMTDSGLRASERIKDVLTYSSLGRKEFVIQKTNMNKLVDKVIADLKQTISEKGAKINVAALPELEVNEPTMMLLFQNLIANAIKFNKTPPVIGIRGKLREEDALFEIEDNGIGISESSKEKIFGMFSRLHPSQYPGTGIGLAICKKVVDLHGGRIWVQSKVDKGTTFLFTISSAQK